MATVARMASAGQRSRYVRIEYRTDPEAQFEQWDTLDWVWMSRSDAITARETRERFTGDQEVAAAETMWVMPYRADMDPELVDVPAVRRLVYHGRTYDIRSASPSGWQREIELTTLARVG
jgi:head-tail adaptor